MICTCGGRGGGGLRHTTIQIRPLCSGVPLLSEHHAWASLQMTAADAEESPCTSIPRLLPEPPTPPPPSATAVCMATATPALVGTF